MGGLDHGPNQPDKSENATTAAGNARLGLRLFTIYTLLYAGFVLINTFQPDWMEVTPLAGVNLAVLLGFALIIAAFVLALLYGWLCRGQGSLDSSK